jgi:putative ABC transport system permease protein
MIGNALLLAVREIRRNLLRAGLTTFGIIMGVGAVIAMVTLGSGASASVTGSIASLGRNLVIIQPGTKRLSGGGAASSSPSFTLEDVDAIRREIPDLRAVAPIALRTETVVAGNLNHPTQIMGTENTYFAVRDWFVGEGREFTEAEIRGGRTVCILGQKVKAELFGAQNPLGTNVRVRDASCEVVGVLALKGQSTFGQDQDDVVVMPLRAMQRRIIGNTSVGMIWVAGNTSRGMPKLIDDVTKLLRERRHLSNAAPDDFQASDMAQVNQLMQQVTRIMTLFLSAVAAISLLVGGIGIMNIMLVSVTERTREIGVRLAIGAREQDVLTQFLVEAVTMSALGGLIGIALGLGASAIGAHFLSIPFVPSPGIVLIAFAFSAVIGVAFGYFPARRAARLDPIESLRHE